MEITIETRALSNSKLSFGLLTLNRPKALNSLNLEMVRVLHQQLSAWQADVEIAFVVIKGEGERAFCAGGDISALYHSLVDDSEQVFDSQHYCYQFFHIEYQLNALIHFYTKPIVALGQGVLMGGGVGLFMGASHKVVFSDTRYAMPEVAIGLYPDVGATWLLSRLPQGVGEYLALTGSSINAHDCGLLGLADVYIEDHTALDLVTIMTTFDYIDTCTAHYNLDRLFLELRTAWQPELSPIAIHFDKLRTLTLSDSTSEFKLALQRINTESPNEFFQRGLQALAYASPLSIEITWCLMLEHRRSSVLEVLERDFWVSLQCCANGDFKEGVRALLIDKDKRPKWREATTITSQVAQEFCQPNWQN